MLKLAVVGFGAIGQELARALRGAPDVEITQIVASRRSIERVTSAAAHLAPCARVTTEVEVAGEWRPDLLAECAGHAALVSHVAPALRAGIPCVVASVGALADVDCYARLEDAARSGRTTVRLVAGAVGGIDSLDAARVGGLEGVRYVGRKPPLGWKDTPAERVCVLSEITGPCLVFEGSARDAALLFPKNANVAATIAFAGLGLDRTEVTLIADPGVERNVHTLQAWGTFGRFEIQLENRPLSTNPKSSALTVYSVVRAVRNAAGAVIF
jgi:aspartate dehydrogenase